MKIISIFTFCIQLNKIQSEYPIYTIIMKFTDTHNELN